MALNPQDLPSDRLADQLARIYEQAQQNLAHEVELLIRTGQIETRRQRRLQLAALLRYLDEIGHQTDPTARQLIGQAFDDGGVLAIESATTAGHVGLQVTEQAFASVNREAVKVASDLLLGRLKDARVAVGRSIDDAFAKATRQTTVRALLGELGSAQTAQKALARRLSAQGYTAFVDSAGRNWKLGTYAKMAVRTATREAVVEAQINRFAAHGVDLARISTHGSSCPICGPLEGRLISLGGDTLPFQGEPVASGPFPPFHPNCRHTIFAVSRFAEGVRRESGLPGGRGGSVPHLVSPRVAKKQPPEYSD